LLIVVVVISVSSSCTPLSLQSHPICDMT
jgi:hypothetical protein